MGVCLCQLLISIDESESTNDTLLGARGLREKLYLFYLDCCITSCMNVLLFSVSCAFIFSGTMIIYSITTIFLTLKQTDELDRS